MMFPDLIGYHFYRATPLPPLASHQAYDYIMAANGLFIRARSQTMAVCFQIAPQTVRGLRPLQATISLRYGRLPVTMLQQCIVDAKEAKAESGQLLEALYHVYLANGQYRLVKPAQAATPGSVTSTAVYPQTLLDLHTHGEMAAFFSGTDNQDEQGLRFYGVLGKLNGRPEMRLRVGCYGYFYECPLDTLFSVPPSNTRAIAEKNRL